MQSRINHKNEILRLLKQSKQTHRYTLKGAKFVRFDPADPDEAKVIPEMSDEDIRKYTCGPFAMKLASPYVSFWAELGTDVKFSRHCTPRLLLIKASGLKSRYSPRIAREVYLLFKGKPHTLQDTLCTCHGGLRPIGGCAHAIAILCLLGQLTNRIEPRKQTRSEEMLKCALSYYQNSESESESESESGSGSASESESVSESESESE